MAKLTQSQVEKRLESEKRKLDAMRKKQEIQKKKELYGENWKTVEQQKLQKEIENELGSEKTPKIYDFKDLYDYFDVIKFYKDRKNKSLKMDYEQFLDSEDQYREAIEELNKEIGINNSEKETIEKGKRGRKKKEVDGKPLKELQDEKGLVEDGVNKQDNDEPVPLDENQVPIEEGEYSIQGLVKGKLNQTVSTYFNRYVPLYNKHVCTCCGVPKPLNDYYISYNLICSDRVDDKGNFHMYVCKECCQKLFSYCYNKLANKNVELAMQYVCSYLNLYWDVDLFYRARSKFEESGRRGTLVGVYIQVTNSDACGKTFMESPFLTDEQYNSANRIVETNPNEAPFDWDKEDARNKTTVIRMVGYDPFEYYPDEDKKILYRDLLNILDEGMQSDLVKFQAGIQIVQGFFKIRKLNKQEFEMERDNAPLADKKAVSDLKGKELANISKYCSDNGFSERYATAKAKGENTFTGILNKMNEQKFEKALMNRYDIETSETIQQAADASFKAIFNQLGMSESEIWKQCQEQFKELTSLRKKNAKLEEDLRLAKVQVAEMKLKEKEKEQNVTLGIEDFEDD